VGAGVLTAEQAMVFVRERGNAMAAAAAQTPTGMTAVLGGDRDEVVAAAERHGLTAANENGGGQIVVAGTLEQLEAFAADPPAKSRLRPLQVAGAFHTRHMRPAAAVLAQHSQAIYVHDARLRLISNADGDVVQSGRDVLTRLVTQVSSPVRWDLCMQTMSEIGITALLELPPAGTLTGLAKRALPGIETLAVNTPDDLPAAWDLINRHASMTTMSQAPTWRLLVAPSKGTFKLGVDSVVGDALVAGAAIGSIVNLRDEQPVLAPHGGTVVEWLVEDGDPVSPGQPIVRLHPEAAST
jgi:[acyl-carrier-protein] S-malonyltransferase